MDAMRIVIAPDSFKESMTAAEAAAAIERGVRTALPEAVCTVLPVADGGEGTLDALAAALGAERRGVDTGDALGRPVRAAFALAADGLAVIEVAQAVGLGLLDGRRDIFHATTTGVAALVLAALDAGATRLLVGLGGTATCDGGAGLLAGLGVRFLDAAGRDVRPDPDGLADLARVDASALDSRARAVSMTLACDVTNPLLGPTGAAAVFGPQKGATPEQVPMLDVVLAKVADGLAAAGFADVRHRPGAGAAGGLGAAFLALGADLRPGFGVVADAIALEPAIASADLVITGEGSLDAQTGSGKAPAGVAALATRHGVPVLAFAGRVPDPDAALRLGFAAAVPIAGSLPLAQALVRGPELLEAAVAATLTRPSSGRSTVTPAGE
jgi:glycerate 2-kinase